MDAKLTLSFDAAVAEKAKAFAEANNISLSRLVEFMLSKVTDKRYRSIDELPVSDWVNAVAEGDTGLYVTSPVGGTDELISTQRAVFYALIF